jgi:hypothetical protein
VEIVNTPLALPGTIPSMVLDGAQLANVGLSQPAPR